mmetsp:Transcript_33328/g.66362  ORF Transcript_33328/g.66362 Transcript_33328/m.66362 type:complete len:375 (-) Transcript_33328:163-1287(-)
MPAAVGALFRAVKIRRRRSLSSSNLCLPTWFIKRDSARCPFSLARSAGLSPSAPPFFAVSSTKYTCLPFRPSLPLAANRHSTTCCCPCAAANPRPVRPVLSARSSHTRCCFGTSTLPPGWPGSYKAAQASGSASSSSSPHFPPSFFTLAGYVCGSSGSTGAFVSGCRIRCAPCSTSVAKCPTSPRSQNTIKGVMPWSSPSSQPTVGQWFSSQSTTLPCPFRLAKSRGVTPRSSRCLPSEQPGSANPLLTTILTNPSFPPWHAKCSALAPLLSRALTTWRGLGSCESNRSTAFLLPSLTASMSGVSPCESNATASSFASFFALGRSFSSLPLPPPPPRPRGEENQSMSSSPLSLPSCSSSSSSESLGRSPVRAAH